MLQNWTYRLLMFVMSSVVSVDAGNLLAAETPTKPAVPAHTPGGPEKLSAEAAIRQSLTKKVSLSYLEVPLRQVAEDLEVKLGVPVRLDTEALKEAGVDEDSPMTFSIANVSARAAISLILRKLQLTAITAHETLLITSPSVAESALVTRVYDVADFASDDGAADDDQHALEALAEVIKSCVEPSNWEENGGRGTIRCFTSAGIRAVVVSQNQEVLLQIDDLLEQLRSVRHARPVGRKASSEPATRRREAVSPQLPVKDSPPGPKISAAEKAIRQALEKRLTVQFKETPLSDAIRQLAKLASVPIVVDKKKTSDDVDSTGVDSAAPVTLDASGRSLRSILDEVVHPLKLAWTYHAESLLITSESESESDAMQNVRVYNLADLPAYRNRRGEGIPDYEKIMDAITSVVSPETWQEAGGRGTIAECDKAGIHGIVVSQTWQTHLEIEALLERLRKLRGHALTADDIKKLPPPPDPADSQGADLPPSKPLEADPRRDSIVVANNQFAFDLHKKLGGDNRFFSPSSAATAMAMVYTGARGKTAEEIARVLHFTMPQAEVAPAFQSLLATLPGANHPGCTLTSANRLWGRQGYGFLEPFLATTRDRFGGGLVEVDFDKPAPACALINAWADQKTGGKIKQIVTPDLIRPQLRFILTNAVYFKGRWAEPFTAMATKPAPFFSGDERIEVPLMHQVIQCRYGSFDDIRVLEKSYRGGEIAMTILLPKQGPQALADLEQSLSAETVKEWSSKLQSRMVDISLPKFRLETDVPLMGALASLGMARVFDPHQADLSGINGGKEPLWLDWILQRAYVSVDEEGTKAAAVTGTFGGGFAGPEPRIAVFRADHPFVFLIRDTRTGCILILGRLVKPGK